MQEISCRDVVEQLTDYLEGALAPADRSALEEHLQRCEGCADYLEQLRTTIRLTGTLSEDALDPEMAAKLLAVFQTWKAR